MGAFLTFLVVAAVIAWQIFVQTSARRQLDIAVRMSEQEAAEIVRSSFNAVWGAVDGPGDLNYRPRLRGHAPTVSITFSPNGVRECEVSIWTSAWRSHYGIMAHAQLMWRKRRRIALRLTESLTAPAGS